MILTPDQKEKQVKALIAQNEKDKAVKLLFEMINDCAVNKQFEKAENLRKQMIELDSMALNEIIQSAEIIEDEKRKAIDNAHKKAWSSIYSSLNDTEANALYFSLKKIKIMPGKMLIKQGRMNNKLFFIDSGTLNVIHEQGNAEVFIKKITSGEPVGNRTFFNISLATTTIITRDTVTVHFLERGRLIRLLESLPGLDSKLQDLISKLVKTTVEDILKSKSLERRGHKRYRASGKVLAYILNDKNEPGKPIKGLLEDISEGGVAFNIRQSQKETARLLLGRKVLLNIVSDKMSKKIPKNGMITGVYNQLFNNYTINFRFSKPLSHNTIKTLMD